MTDNTIKQRQAALRAREREAGLIRRTVTIPKSKESELKKMVSSWIDDQKILNIRSDNEP